MEKKGIAETISNITREASHMTNHLGQEARSVGNAFGGEEAGAALNAAGTGTVMLLSGVALGLGGWAKHNDKKISEQFYGKLDAYGGLGVPMDDECKPLTTVSFFGSEKADLLKEKHKTLTSAEVITKHIAHAKDTAVTRSFKDGLSIWDTFLFSRQLVKNRVAFGIRGSYPPRLELTLNQFNVNMMSPDDLSKLVNKFREKGVYLTASGASDRVGQFNLTGSSRGLSDALDVLNSAPFKDNKELNALRKKLKNVLLDDKQFSCMAPALSVPSSVFTAKGMSSEEVSKLTAFLEEHNLCVKLDGQRLDNFTADGREAFIKEVCNSASEHTGNLEIVGDKDSITSAIGAMRRDSLNPGTAKFAGFEWLRQCLEGHLKGEEMTEFTRDFLSLKRELKGFDSIAFQFHKGRCIVQTDHGLEDIIQVLMAANRVPDSWNKGLKKQLSEWAKDNALDDRYSASFVYGEKQGAANVQRTLYTRVTSEELASEAAVQKGGYLFWDKDEDGVDHCMITYLRGEEVNKVAADGTRAYQEKSLELLGDIGRNMQAPAAVQPSADAQKMILEVAEEFRQSNPELKMTEALEKARQFVAEQLHLQA